MHGLCEFADKELKKLERKAEESGDLNEREVEYAKNLAKLKMALLTNKAMEAESYSNTGMSYGYRGMPYYDNMDGMSDGYSGARGRTGNVRRDSMGRYSRGEGYSYADARDDMMKELHEAMSKAPDEETRQKFKRFMKQLEE